MPSRVSTFFGEARKHSQAHLCHQWHSHSWLCTRRNRGRPAGKVQTPGGHPLGRPRAGQAQPLQDVLGCGSAATRSGWYVE